MNIIFFFIDSTISSTYATVIIHIVLEVCQRQYQKRSILYR